MYLFIFVHIALGQVQSTTIHFKDSSGSTFSKLIWNPPELNERQHPIWYIVEYNDLCSQEWKRLNKYLVPGPKCLVDGLIPAGDYQFRVTSVFEKEHGEHEYYLREEDEFVHGPQSEPSASKLIFLGS